MTSTYHRRLFYSSYSTASKTLLILCPPSSHIKLRPYHSTRLLDVVLRLLLVIVQPLDPKHLCNIIRVDALLRDIAKLRSNQQPHVVARLIDQVCQEVELQWISIGSLVPQGRNSNAKLSKPTSSFVHPSVFSSSNSSLLPLPLSPLRVSSCCCSSAPFPARNCLYRFLQAQ